MTTLYATAIIAVIVIAIAWLNLSARRQWKFHHTRNAVALHNGEEFSGLVMRKKVNGSWVYRKPTADECESDEWWNAIR